MPTGHRALAGRACAAATWGIGEKRRRGIIGGRLPTGIPGTCPKVQLAVALQAPAASTVSRVGRRCPAAYRQTALLRRAHHFPGLALQKPRLADQFAVLFGQLVHLPDQVGDLGLEGCRLHPIAGARAIPEGYRPVFGMVLASRQGQATLSLHRFFPKGGFMAIFRPLHRERVRSAVDELIDARSALRDTVETTRDLVRDAQALSARLGTPGAGTKRHRSRPEDPGGASDCPIEHGVSQCGFPSFAIPIPRAVG